MKSYEELLLGGQPWNELRTRGCKRGSRGVYPLNGYGKKECGRSKSMDVRGNWEDDEREAEDNVGYNAIAVNKR